ncbi:MAG TPA: hypothetical protein VMF88_15370 [Bacteroidota bacterium]|nr:hypothetical protein [Bacteroidota bacterium]
MNLSPEILAELFRQCAFISALIAGFSFAFLAVILTNKTTKTIDDWTAGFAIAATAGLIVCALGWTLSVPRVLELSLNSSANGPIQVPQTYLVVHRSLSITFIACFFFFLTSLGLSGWIRSRRLGVVSLIITIAAAFYAIWILRFFIR